jgi:hypothetical protein
VTLECADGEKVAMDCTQPTPRVNGAQLRLMEGKVVRLVGQVTAHEGATVTLECADGEKVSVQQTAGSAYETKYVEVVGRVVGANVVQEMDYTNFGDNFDLKAYNQLCELANSPEHTPLFLA